MRVYDGDVEITVENNDDDGIFTVNIIDNPTEEHISFGVTKDTLIELQAKLQVIIENTD
jgi:hypothetical protein